MFPINDCDILLLSLRENNTTLKLNEINEKNQEIVLNKSDLIFPKENLYNPISDPLIHKGFIYFNNSYFIGMGRINLKTKEYETNLGKIFQESNDPY